MTTHGRIALVTGASSGIGRATAEALAAEGWTVYASARRPEAVAAYAGGAGSPIVPLALDVTDEASMQAAVGTILREAGRVDLLVNNAGYGLYGPLEAVPVDDLRRQFETNVFGLVRLCQLVLPAMRSQGGGRIVNVGSIGGTLTTPFGGPYHATKYALEALSDALRLEVAPFGVRVVLVQPTGVKTNFVGTVRRNLANGGPGSPYAPYLDRVDAMMDRVFSAPGILEAADVAKVIVRAATAEHPRARYRAGMSAHAMVLARRFMPDALWDAMIGRTLMQAPREERGKVAEAPA